MILTDLTKKKKILWEIPRKSINIGATNDEFDRKKANSQNSKFRKFKKKKQRANFLNIERRKGVINL